MKIGILGSGESARGAALLSQKRGYQVFVSELNLIAPEARSELAKNNIPFEERGHDIDILSKSDYIIKSPGIPPSASVIEQLKSRACTIISEIEWAYRHTQGKIIAITGSNGKTTTTSMVAYLLTQLGKKVGLVGNVGHSFARAVAEEDQDFWALEVSSFQLEDVIEFRPHVAAFLNLTPDHLDRYGDMLTYGRAKSRIWKEQSEKHKLIYWKEDEWIRRLLVESSPRASLKAIDAEMVSREDWSHLNLYGEHNQLNALFAQEMVKCILGESSWNPQIWEDFKAPEHRLERFWEHEGVVFINDSKATNLDATEKALKAVGDQVILILGGVDKGNDYSLVENLVLSKVRLLIALGKDTQAIEEAFAQKVVLRRALDLSEMVQILKQEVRSGDQVLLAPACASFDLFDNYEDRGRKYKEIIRQNFGGSQND